MSGALVLDVLSNGSILVALSDRLKSEPKTADDVLDADVFTATWFDVLLPSNRVHRIGTVAASGSYNGRAGMYQTAAVHFCENSGLESHWAHEKRALTFEGMKMRDLLKPENVSADFRNHERLRTLLQQDRRVVWITYR